VYTAIVPEDDKHNSTPKAPNYSVAELTCCLVYIMRCHVPLDKEVARPAPTACGIGLPQGVTIVDFKFLDEKSLLVLCSQKGMDQVAVRSRW
jgi:anaphase-promoting complex subunit 4